MIYMQIRDKELELLVIHEKKKQVVVQKVIKVPLSSQLVVNGFIQDEAAMYEELALLVRKENLRKKKVVLTLDSTFAVYRELTTPVLRKKQLDAFVYHNLKSQINNMEEHVVDYAILHRDKNLQLLAVAAPTALIDPFKRVLKRANLVLHSIVSTPLNMIRGYFSMGKEDKVESQVFVYYNGEIINSVLFNHGKYVFANAFRTFGSANSQTAITERISQLMQFQKAQNNGLLVQQVNVYGLIDAAALKDMSELLKTSVVQGMHERVIKNKTGHSLAASMSNVFAGLVVKHKNYNLARGLNQSLYTEVHLEKKRWTLVLALLVVNIIGVSAAGSYVYYLRSLQQQRKDELQIRLNNPILQDKYLKAVELTGLNTVYGKQLDEVRALQDTLRDQRAFHYALYESIMALKPKEIILSSLAYFGESVSLSLSSSQRELTYEFVRSLRESGLFYDVMYPGFNYNESTKRYEFQVQLLLKVGVDNETE